MRKVIASLIAAAGFSFVSPVQASEPVTLRPVHQSVVSSGAFALSQPEVHCYNGCSFHYFAPGDTYTADYAIQSPLDGYWYYVVTIGSQVGYVLRPPVIGYGA